MKRSAGNHPACPKDIEESSEGINYDFGLNRRCFVQLLGTGLLIASGTSPALAQRRGDRGGNEQARPISARIHLAKDGSITVMTGKVEGGQGARTELSQAAAEELCVPVGEIQIVMADTDLVPDDGITAGSRSTPATVPAMRQAAAAARELLIQWAARRWGISATMVAVKEGKAWQRETNQSLSYAEFAADEDTVKALAGAVPGDVPIVAQKDWKILGHSRSRLNGADVTVGAHQYPSDINRPGMLYGKVLRPPAYGAKLLSVDLEPAKELEGVICVQDEDFVGLAAPTSFRTRQALALIQKTAKWQTAPHPASKEVFEHLRSHVREGLPANPFADELSKAKHVLHEAYHVAYVQHAPLEPRAAVAEWADGKLTVWTGTQNPFGYRSELTRAFHVSADKVRVIVPDFGSGYGGKHTAEVAVEAARIARAANRPVSLRWTREEEFTWAYFRPAALITVEASLDPAGALTSWHMINVNSGAAALDSPYHIPNQRSRFLNSEAPLRQGSYRALASTANTFARESCMDELAAAAGSDPLEFRLAHLENPRLRAVLETAAKRFGWREKLAARSSDIGVGLACGTEKGSFVAACAEVQIDRSQKRIVVRHVCQVFECGAVLNPANLYSQVQGAIIMGLGPALREEMSFENGEVLNASFRKYQVPRFADVPELDIHLLDRPELASVGGGETPIIAIAPAIANAVFHAIGIRVREMPIKLPESKAG